MRKQLITASKFRESERQYFTAGHESNMQFVKNDNDRRAAQYIIDVKARGIPDILTYQNEINLATL